MSGNTAAGGGGLQDSSRPDRIGRGTRPDAGDSGLMPFATEVLDAFRPATQRMVPN